MRIVCPFCGERDAAEFSYGGDATRLRPDEADADSGRWCDYVFRRDNPRGWHHEYWQHLHGCRAWLYVNRNTATHEIREVRMAGEHVARLRQEASE